MSEILTDDTIRDFLFDYARYKRLRTEYTDIQSSMVQRLPLYVKRFRMLAHRMTQKELAEALEISDTYVSKLENGHENPSPEFLDKFAEFIHAWEEDEETEHV